MATKFKPPTPPFIAARHHGGRQAPKAIVLHGTVSSDNKGTARNIAAWWHGPTSPVTSAHYIVDPNEVIQTVGDHTVAFHCGFNTGSIAIEFCDEQAGPANRWADADSSAILRRGARLTAQLCLAYDIQPVRPTIAALKKKGPHGIYGHDDSRLAFGNTTHTDPRDFPWAKFLAMVKTEISILRGRPGAAPKPDPKPIQTGDFDIVVETNNVMSLPLNKKPLETIMAGRTSSVRMLQEIDGGGIKQAAAKVPGFSLAPIPEGKTYAAGILYNRAIWERITTRYPKQYDGAAGISYTRHLCVTELKHRATGQKVAFISYHAVTSGNDKKRKAMRAQGLAVLRKEINFYKRNGIPVIVGGDYNTRLAVHPSASVRVAHAIDQVYAWSGKRWSFKRRAQRIVHTPSDHDALVVRLSVKLK